MTELVREFRPIVRFLGTDLDGSLKVPYALTAVKGIGVMLGYAITRAAGIDTEKRLGFLSDEELKKLEEVGLVSLEGVEEVRGALARRYGVPFNSLYVKLREEAQAWMKPPEPLRRLIEGETVLVVGSPDVHGPFLARARDQHLAIKVGLVLGLMGAAKLEVKLDTEVDDTDLKKNVVCLGGPTVNMLTWRVNEQLPVFFNSEKENQIVSRLSGRVYGEDVNGVVEVLENPFSKDRRIVILAGKRIEGTRASVVAFTERLKEAIEGNVYAKSTIARVVEGIDRDSDGLIDDVVFLE